MWGDQHICPTRNIQRCPDSRYRQPRTGDADGDTHVVRPPLLFASSNLRQRLVRCFHQYPEPVLAQFGEPFHGALLPEFSELPYDHGSQAIAWRILVVEHMLENGVEQGQEVLTTCLDQSRSPRFFRLNQQVPQQSDPPLGMGRNCNKRRALAGVA